MLLGLFVFIFSIVNCVFCGIVSRVSGRLSLLL